MYACGREYYNTHCVLVELKYEWDITSTQCMPVAESITIPTVCWWKYEWHIPSTQYVPVAAMWVGHHIYPLCVCGSEYECDITSTQCMPVAWSMNITIPILCLWQGA